MKNKIFLVVLICLAIIFAYLIGIRYTYINVPPIITDQNKANAILSTDLIITEIASNNKSIFKDESLNYSPYIEIYNDSDNTINLEGFGLSDEFSLPFKWTFPEKIINPHEYIIVFADKKDINTKYVHTDFKLSEFGNTLIFSTNTGAILSKVTVGQCVSDMTYGLIDDEYKYFKTGSPYREAFSPIQDVEKYINRFRNNTINFSRQAGFYNQEFTLGLDTVSEYVDIRYTLDGSDPTKDAIIYTTPFKIEMRNDDINKYIPINSTYGGSFKPNDAITKRATVVKAQCFLDTKSVGDIITKTYFVDEKGAELYTFPIVSLTTEPDNFWSSVDGIYVVGDHYLQNVPEDPQDYTPANYHERGTKWERPCYVEYFENGVLTFKQALGVRIFGGWSRASQKKSLKLFIKDYSKSNINYNIFKKPLTHNGEVIESFDSIILRSGATDSENAIFRDALLTGIMSSNLDIQAAKPVILFINGEYWGIYFFREDINEGYIQNHYGIEEKDIVYLKDYSDVDNQDDMRHYKKYMFFAMENDLTIDKNYTFIKNGFDLQNMIDYYSTQIYCANKDFPHHNVALWRKRIEPDTNIALNYDDGRYRYILFDTDYGFDLYGDQLDDNMFEFLFTSDREDFIRATAIVEGLLKNNDFKNQFIATFCDRLNTVFSANNTKSEISYWKKLLEPEIEANVLRYGLFDSDVNGWYKEVDKMNEFAEKRPEIVFEQMAQYFDKQVIDLFVSAKAGGKINMNNRIMINQSFSGMYISDIPITLSAIPNEGFEFVGWSNGQTQQEIIISCSDRVNEIEARFKKAN